MKTDQSLSLSVLRLGLVAALAACSPARPADDASSTDASDAATQDALRDTGSSDAGLDATVDATADVGSPVDVIDVPQDVPPICLSGQSTGDAGVADATTSEGGAGDSGLPGGSEYIYVLSDIAVDSLFTTTRYGFNLDTFASTSGGTTGCGKADTFARFDFDQNVAPGCTQGVPGCQGGVDNQLPVLLDRFSTTLGFDVANQVVGQVPYHRLVILMRLTNVDSFMNDSDVGLQVFEGYPTYNTSCMSVLPDREYQVALSSLRPGGTTLNDAKFSVRGQIQNGRFTVQADPSTVFELPLRGIQFPLTLRIHEMRLRFDPTSFAGRRGNLGGLVYGDEFYNSVPSAFRRLVDDFIFDSVDLPVGNVCADMNGPRFGAMGLGMGFSAVSARLTVGCTITDRGMPGVCGTQGNP